MKKKLITVLASLTALSLLATACSGGGAGNKTSLLQKGLELAGQLDLLAESEDYRKSVTTAQEVTGVVEEIGSYDYDSPRAVYQIQGADTAYLGILALSGANLSQEIQDILRPRFTSAVASMINGQQGVTILAATALLTVSDSFLYSGLDKSLIYLYLYEGKYSIMVSFSPDDEGIVNANASIVADKDLSDLQNTDDVSAYLMGRGLAGVTVTPVEQ